MNTIEQTPFHPVAVGDIFRMSWGYDQTNVDYFQVVKTTPKGVYVREIGSVMVPGTDGRNSMSCKVCPAPDNFLEHNASWCGPLNKPLFRRLSGPESFCIEGRYFARRVARDSSAYCSWYA
jgi:hypothetical protein